MAGGNDQLTQPSDDASRDALGFVHRLLADPEGAAPSLEGLLRGLAASFRARAAGLADLGDGKPVTRVPADGADPPWQARRELFEEILAAGAALSLPAEGGSWLVTALDGGAAGGWLLWLEAEAGHAWSPAEAAALALAAQVLGRTLSRPARAPAWVRRLHHQRRQQRLEDAAAVTRRLTHDYGNVLTGILGFTELALAQLPPDSPLRLHLREVYAATQEGVRLTARLRLGSRRQWPLNQPACLAEVVTQERQRLLGLYGSGLCLDIDVPADLPPVALDPGPLRELLAVLLENAAEAVAGRGRVRVVARPVTLTAEACAGLLGGAEPGPHVELRVEDDGPGLSAEAQQGLFAEPFFSTKPRRGGLGLSTAYGIARSHRGGLSVEPGTGRGTVARVCLPALSPPAPAVAAGKILVVDDDPMILRFVSATLQRAGYLVETAGSGDEALRRYEQAAPPFGLVLSDVAMPSMDGFELARRLRRRDGAVNVLFMSGHAPAGPPPQPNGLEFEVLSKPFPPEGLLRAVGRALRHVPHPAANGALSPARAIH